MTTHKSLACMVVWACLLADAHAEETPPLFIGIEKNRKPYTYLDDKLRAQGIVVETVKSACKQMQVDCKFVGGVFNELLTALQGLKLSAVVVLDPALPPAADSLKLNHPPKFGHLTLTAPVCQLQPIYLQKKTALARTKPEDFKDALIGVQEGTVFHKYIMDSHNAPRQVKVYPLLELAIIDLVFDRVDAVLGDEAFLQARALDTSLAEFGQFSTVSVDPQSIPVSTAMVLALRERDTDLFKQLGAALKVVANPNVSCVQLLQKPAKK